MNTEEDIDCKSREIDDAYDKFRAPPEFMAKVKAVLDEQYPTGPNQKEKMARAEKQLRTLIEKRKHIMVNRTEDAL